MIEQFKNLNSTEQDLLYDAPVLVSVLASCSFNKINEAQKADAIKLAHLKTFTAAPALLSYYTAVEKNFKEKFEAMAGKYFPFDDEKRKELQAEINQVHLVLKKLDPQYAQALYKSLEGYAKHVKKADHSIFQDFIFPIPIPGLSE